MDDLWCSRRIIGSIRVCSFGEYKQCWLKNLFGVPFPVRHVDLGRGNGNREIDCGCQERGWKSREHSFLGYYCWVYLIFYRSSNIGCKHESVVGYPIDAWAG